MKMGLLADNWRYSQGNKEVAFAAGHQSAFMGGGTSYSSPRTSFPPGYSPALNHTRQGFSLSSYPHGSSVAFGSQQGFALSEDAPYRYTSFDGDSVTFSSKAGSWNPRY